MIEILVLIALSKKVGGMAKEKGHNGTVYALMAAALWIGFEIGGALVGGLVIAIFDLSWCLAYLLALACAACGGGLAYLIADALPQRAPLPPPDPAETPVEDVKVKVAEPVIDEGQLTAFLQEVEALAQSADLEGAAQVMEQALSDNPSWAARLAGYPRQTSFDQTEPVSGYALLVHLAGRAKRKDLALQYFRRMLELNPADPSAARQAAREAKIVKDARPLAKSMGVSFGRLEY
jgi:MFS family permease